MSGTGKSSVIRGLAARGYKAIDTDDGWCDPLSDGRQIWREDAIQLLLKTEDADVLFVAGCQENQVKFHPQYRVLSDVTTIEPLLRQVADHEIRTTMPLNDVVTTILRLAGA
jgi:hypothetical protein